MKLAFQSSSFEECQEHQQGQSEPCAHHGNKMIPAISLRCPRTKSKMLLLNITHHRQCLKSSTRAPPAHPVNPSETSVRPNEDRQKKSALRPAPCFLLEQPMVVKLNFSSGGFSHSIFCTHFFRQQIFVLTFSSHFCPVFFVHRNFISHFFVRIFFSSMSIFVINFFFVHTYFFTMR